MTRQFTHGDSLRADRTAFVAEGHTLRQRSHHSSGRYCSARGPQEVQNSRRGGRVFANRSDSDALLGAFLAIWNAPENLRCLGFSLEPLEKLQVRDWFDNAARDHIRYFAAVTNAGGYRRHQRPRVDPISPFEILGLAVRPDSQGIGVGRLLVPHTLELVKSVSSGCVRAAVFADNVRMLRLLLSSGFIPVRIDYHRRADGGDLVVLQRRK